MSTSNAAPRVARAQVSVPVSPEDAFTLFTEDIGLWWRRDTRYWNDPERGLSVRIEPGVNGRFIEVYDLQSASGMEVGRVTAWEPGRRSGADLDAGRLARGRGDRAGDHLRGWAGICVFDAAPEEVDRIVAEDPGIQAGLFTYELHPVGGFPGSALP